MANYQVDQKLSGSIYGLKDTDNEYQIQSEIIVNGVQGVWRLADPKDVKIRTQDDTANFNAKTSIYSSNGYAGAVYINDVTHEVVIVNAGTQSGLDYYSDAKMALGLVPDQYASARQMAQEAITLAKSLGYSVSATGHSLGGSLAQLIAIEFGIPAVTFNAYGVGGIMNIDSTNTTGTIVETAEFLINQQNYPELASSYKNQTYDAKQMVNYKMGGDVIGNAGKDIGITAIVGGEGNILTTIIGTVTLTMSDIILLRDPLAVMDLGHLLAQHGITEFANFDPMKFDFDSLMQGGGIPQSIIPNYTPTQYDPITLDLDGDGIETVGLSAGVLFDHNGDGIQTGTGWVGKDDGLLVLDKNNNGTIDNGAELFGDNTILKNGQKAKDGFAAISDLDLNQDGKLNSSDAAFANLRVWQDINQDGFSQATELKTLDELGISSINTVASITGGQNQNNGNVIIGSSSFEREDGSTNTSGALNFTGNTFTREFSDVIDTSAVAGLPDMRASGTVRDLREAAALSPDLAIKLQTYAESNTRNSADLEALLNSWASTSDMQTLASTLKPGSHPAGGRGTNLNQSEIDKLNVLEKFTGLYGGISNFSDPMDSYDGVTNGRYSGTYYGINLNADMINKSYALLSKSVDSAISVQTDLKEVMNDVMFKFSADGVTLDMSNVYAKATGDNASNVLGDVINLYTYFKENAGELFPATAQSETLSWIKDRIVTDGFRPVGLNETFEQLGITTTGDDFIITANQSSTITAGDGNDQVYGLSGNDVIYAGTGNDIVDGGSGNDTVSGGKGDDVIDGGSGNDILYGNQGNNSLSGGDGDDVIYGSQASLSSFYPSGASSAYGDLGHYDGNNILDGGTGNDTLKGGWKADTYVFNKGDGNDTIIEQLKDFDWYGVKSGYKDVIQFGAGITASDLNYTHVGNDFVVTIGTGSANSMTIKDWYLNADRRIEEFKFADGSVMSLVDMMNIENLYSGVEGVDTVFGWDGKDKLVTNGGDDMIYSYGGNDTVDAGVGNDYVESGIGNDIVDGGSGNDTVLGGWGDDVINGSDGNDVIYGNQGNNSLSGGDGDDVIYGSQASLSSYFAGGDGPAYSDVGYYDGNNIINGGIGNDALYGGWKSDTYVYNKGDGNDTVIEQLKDADWDGVKTGYKDVVQFGAGITASDLSYTHVGNDLLVTIGTGSADNITIKDWYVDADRRIEEFKFTDGSVMNLVDIMNIDSVYSGAEGIDTVFGGDGEDKLVANGGDNKIYGYGGNDTIDAGAGNDYVEAGVGNDNVVGSTGNDTIHLEDGNDIGFGGDGNDSIYGSWGDDNIYGGAGDDILDGGSGNDYFEAGDGNNILYGGDGGDYLKSGNGNNILYGGDGGDYLKSGNGNNTLDGGDGGDYLKSGNGNNTLDGGDGDDYLESGDGNDILNGGSGDDYLESGDGDDILDGGSGDDYLYSGTGNDSLNGDLGNDHYQFAAGDGIDIIEDSGGTDVIEFDASVQLADLEFNQVDNDLILLNNKTADQITIKNWAAASDNQIENLILNETSLSLAQLVDDFNRVKIGTIGDDNLLLTKNIAQVNAGVGNDTIVDQTLNNTNYIFNLGDGQDSIRDSGSVADQISFGAGISAEQLLFSQSGNDLVIALNSQDQITIRDYALQDNRIESLNFADGSQINLATTLSQHGILNDTVNPKLTNNDDIIWASTGGTYALREGNNQLVISNSGPSNTVSAGAGNDRVLIMGDSTNKLNLGAGDNVIELNGNGNSTITTGVGNDVIHAGNGDNIIRAGDGDNTITLGAGTQNIVTGRGNDKIELGAGNIALNSGAGDDIVNILNLQTLQQATINLGEGNDQLNVTGTDGLVKVTAGLGADNLQLSGVNTQISDAGGNNLVNIDNHELMTAANNIVRLGAGDDVLNLSSDGTSSLSLGDGNNQLEIIGNGVNSVSAGVDNDHVLILGDSTNKLNLGAGDNLIDIQGNTSNTITTGVGNDVIHVQNGDNIIRAGDGDNFITLGVGTQNIVTGSGNDKIELSSGNVTLNSGAGNDEVKLNQTVASINTLNLGVGDDVLTLNGACGSSTINGSTGNDNFNIQNSAVKLSDGGGDNRLYIDNSAMIGDINTINLGLGNDQVTMLSNGQTTLKTSNGDNLLNLSGTGTFNVSSGTGTDQISSGSGNDILNSGSGADILNANAGNDHLIAGAGNDTLIGGTGDDLLEGGSDNDSYQFNAGDGKDLIKDSSGIDQAAFGNGVAKDDLWFMRSGKDLVVNNTKTLDEIKVNNWFASKNNQLESFSLASGEVLSGQAVASLIQAMAAFNPQPMAESMMTSAQQAQFQDLLKNTWVDPTK